jgi:hypothetical protein
VKRLVQSVLPFTTAGLVVVFGTQCCLEKGAGDANQPNQPVDANQPIDANQPVEPNQLVEPNQPASTGKTYYVAPNGSDASPGSMAKPWATPGYGSRQLVAGDTLVILGGKYVLSRYDEDILIPTSGRAGAWITIRGEEGNRPILAGRDNLSHAIDLSGASYVWVDNIEITHDDAAAGADLQFRDGVVAMGALASHIVLNNLHIHHIDEFGINIQDVNGFSVLDCQIGYCGFGAIGGPSGEQGGLRNLLIKGCSLSYGGHYYQGTDGANRPYDRPDGFGIEESQGPIEIVQTVAEHNYGDGLDSKAANTTLRRCVVANNTCDGIKLWGTNSRIVNCLVYGTGDGVGGASPWAGIVIGTDQAGAYFEITNTTVHDNPTRHAYPMYVQYDSNAATTVVMRNTIIANGYGSVFFGNSVTLTAQNNIFLRGGDVTEQVELAGRAYTTTDIENGALGPGNLCRAPKFISPAWGLEGDYHVTDTSPAIDAGTSTDAPDVDLDGNPRPAGAQYDIGAYER